MIQDIYPHKFYNSYTKTVPDKNSYIVITNKNFILVQKQNNSIKFPKYSESVEHTDKPIYLFRLDNQKFFLAAISQNELYKLQKQGYDFYNISSIEVIPEKELRYASITAYQLCKWYENNKFCGKCGNLLYHADNERALCCKQCDNTVYPKLCPAVIAGVINGDNILLTKYAASPGNSRFALIAGFAEIGETIEETVSREVFEEVGIKVKNICYYKSQPWAYSDTLLFGFFCELDGSSEIQIDSRELSVAKWMNRSEIKIDNDDISLTYDMIRAFKNKKMVCI